MKGLEKVILVIFSLCIIALSVTLILLATEMVDTKSVLNSIKNVLVEYKVWVISIGALASLLSLIGIFGSSSDDENIKSGLAIKSSNGTVYITKETFESIIYNVTKDFAALKNVKVIVNIDELGVTTKIFAHILPDTVVPELTEKLQKSVKDSIQKQTTVDIKEANIKIRGVFVQNEKVN